MDVNPLPLTLPPERQGYIAPTDLLARRQALDDARLAGVWSVAPAPQEITIAGVRCLRFLPSGKSRGIVLHLHGGGFRLGCPEQLGPFAVALAECCAATVICPAYRLAPEYPFPAGLCDAWAVASAVFNSSTGPLLLAGDSAGGGLAAGVTALAVASEMRPIGLMLFSPWLDLRVNSQSYQANAASDSLFTAQSAREAAGQYLQGTAADNKLASPLLGAISDFPATLINVGKGEVLAEDAKQLYTRLIAANIPTQLQLVEAMEHVAVIRDLTLPGAAESFEAVTRFVKTLIPAST